MVQFVLNIRVMVITVGRASYLNGSVGHWLVTINNPLPAVPGGVVV